MGYSEQMEKAYKKARTFAESSKESLIKGFKFALEDIENVRKEAVSMSKMSESELDMYLETHGENLLENIIEEIEDFAFNKREEAKEFPFFADAVNVSADKADEVVELIKTIFDEDESLGWGKYMEIHSTLQLWILKCLCASYKKPSLLGTIVEFLTLPYVVAGVAVANAVISPVGKKRTESNVMPPTNVPITTESSDDKLPFDSEYHPKETTYSYYKEYDEYEEMLARHNYDEDSLESSQEYWEYFYNKYQ